MKGHAGTDGNTHTSVKRRGFHMARDIEQHPEGGLEPVLDFSWPSRRVPSYFLQIAASDVTEELLLFCIIIIIIMIYCVALF